MAVVKLSDEVLLAFFQSHPGLRDGLTSVMLVVRPRPGEGKVDPIGWTGIGVT